MENDLGFIIKETGIKFTKDGKHWTYEGKYYDPNKVYCWVKERLGRGLPVKAPEDSEDRYYYLRHLGQMV